MKKYIKLIAYCCGLLIATVCTAQKSRMRELELLHRELIYKFDSLAGAYPYVHYLKATVPKTRRHQ